MTTVNSIAGNNGFSKVSNTVVTSQNVTNSLDQASMMPLKSVTGYVTPKTAGNYALVNPDGGHITLPANALVQSVFLRGSSNLTGAAGAVVRVVLLETEQDTSPHYLHVRNHGPDAVKDGLFCLAVNVDGSTLQENGDYRGSSKQLVYVQSTNDFTEGKITVTIMYL